MYKRIGPSLRGDGEMYRKWEYMLFLFNDCVDCTLNDILLHLCVLLHNSQPCGAHSVLPHSANSVALVENVKNLQRKFTYDILE